MTKKIYQLLYQSYLAKGERMRATSLLLDETKTHVVIIKRFKNGRHYLVFPGGGIELDETPSQAALRELSEELAIELSDEAIVAETVQNGELIFLIQSKEVVGTLTIHGEEADRSDENNQYLPRWIAIEKLAGQVIYPEIDLNWLYQQLAKEQK